MDLQKLLRYSSIGLATLGLGLGVAAADSSIHKTGPDSRNEITSTSRNSATIRNDNDVDVDNRSLQVGVSGDASVYRNTDGGDATSGDVSNDNSTDTMVDVSNGGGSWGDFWSNGGGGGSIDTTGPNSRNEITTTNTNTLRVTNNNDVDVDNRNVQVGVSGDASVYRNTEGGSATSGSVSNSNSTSTSVNISN